MSEVKVQELDMTYKVSEAAFTLSRVFAGELDSAYVQHRNSQGSKPADVIFFTPPVAQDTEDKESTKPKEDFSLPWDTPQAELPVELAFIWAGVCGGQRKLDLKTVLDNVPRYVELPQAALVNNHRLDGSSKLDKKERSWQQLLLHAMRIPAA